MTVNRFLTSPAAVGQAVRQGRVARGWSQAHLAAAAGVGRRFVVDVESGHARAELGKVLAVLDALEIHALALPAGSPAVAMDDVDLTKVVARFG
jgi:HTH-type transcriptional regulator/antitoxin HipB